MIIIGISAYQKSSDGMGEKYKEATIQTLQKSVEYIEMVSSAVETEAVKYTADTELINYMAGLYDDDKDKIVKIKLSKNIIKKEETNNDLIELKSNDSLVKKLVNKFKRD